MKYDILLMYYQLCIRVSVADNLLVLRRLDKIKVRFLRSVSLRHTNTSILFRIPTCRVNDTLHSVCKRKINIYISITDEVRVDNYLQNESMRH